MTSHDVVFQLRKLSGIKRIGHCGTLDKPATGLLAVVLGRSARLAQFIQEGIKEYIGTIVFGFATDTDDATGEKLISSAGCDVNEGKIRAALPKFVGDIDQLPPRRSAIKVGGEPLYKKDLRGIDFALPLRRVHIESIDIVAFTPSDPLHGSLPTARVNVVCSKGTYIRSIARDLGEAAGCAAHLGGLRRTRIGDFRVEEAHTLDELRQSASRGNLMDAMLAPEVALRGWPSVTVDGELLSYVSHGRTMPVAAFFDQAGTGGEIPAGIFALHDTEGRLVAVGDASGPDIRYLVVLSAI